MNTKFEVRYKSANVHYYECESFEQLDNAEELFDKYSQKPNMDYVALLRNDEIPVSQDVKEQDDMHVHYEVRYRPKNIEDIDVTEYCVRIFDSLEDADKFYEESKADTDTYCFVCEPVKIQEFLIKTKFYE